MYPIDVWIYPEQLREQELHEISKDVNLDLTILACLFGIPDQGKNASTFFFPYPTVTNQPQIGPIRGHWVLASGYIDLWDIHKMLDEGGKYF